MSSRADSQVPRVRSQDWDSEDAEDTSDQLLTPDITPPRQTNNGVQEARDRLQEVLQEPKTPTQEAEETTHQFLTPPIETDRQDLGAHDQLQGLFNSTQESDNKLQHLETPAIVHPDGTEEILRPDIEPEEESQPEERPRRPPHLRSRSRHRLYEYVEERFSPLLPSTPRFEGVRETAGRFLESKESKRFLATVLGIWIGLGGLRMFGLDCLPICPPGLTVPCSEVPVMQGAEVAAANTRPTTGDQPWQGPEVATANIRPSERTGPAGNVSPTTGDPPRQGMSQKGKRGLSGLQKGLRGLPWKGMLQKGVENLPWRVLEKGAGWGVGLLRRGKKDSSRYIIINNPATSTGSSQLSQADATESSLEPSKYTWLDYILGRQTAKNDSIVPPPHGLDRIVDNMSTLKEFQKFIQDLDKAISRYDQSIFWNPLGSRQDKQDLSSNFTALKQETKIVIEEMRDYNSLAFLLQDNLLASRSPDIKTPDSVIRHHNLHVIGQLIQSRGSSLLTSIDTAKWRIDLLIQLVGPEQETNESKRRWGKVFALMNRSEKESKVKKLERLEVYLGTVRNLILGGLLEMEGRGSVW